MSRRVQKNDLLLVADVLSNSSPRVMGRVRDILEKNEADPQYLVRDILEEEGFVGAIDWRAEPDELIDSLSPLLEAKGLVNFDWSFVDDLGNETLENETLLNVVGDRIRLEGLTLVLINMGWDAYDFAVATPDMFERIRHINADGFAITGRT